MKRLPLQALDGFCLNVDVIGNRKPAILALHGFTGNISTWSILSQSIKGEYSLVRVDFLGHGLSDSPEDSQLYDIKHTLAALREILVKLEIDRVHWLGYSMGGRIALAAALGLPEMTSSLILESASPGLSSPEERKERIKSDEALASRIEQKGIADFVAYWESLPLWNSQVRLPALTRENLRKQRLSNNPQGLANSFRGIGTGAQPPLGLQLAQLKIPVLLIAGEEETKYVSIAQKMQQAVPDSLLKIIRESSHAAHLEQPEIFCHEVWDFLGSITLQES